MKEKKLTKSPIVITLYVISALLLAYVCYLIGSTISSIAAYYTQYQMTASFGETFSYVLQAIVQPLTSAIVVFAAAKILNNVRALNPANYEKVEKKPEVKPEDKKAEPKAAEKKPEAKKEEVKKAEPKKDEPAKKPAVKKTETAKKPAAKKTTTAKKPAAKKTTTAKKPAAKKTTTK